MGATVLNGDPPPGKSATSPLRTAAPTFKNVQYSTVADAKQEHSPPAPWLETHGYMQTAPNAAKRLAAGVINVSGATNMLKIHRVDES